MCIFFIRGDIFRSEIFTWANKPYFNTIYKLFTIEGESNNITIIIIIFILKSFATSKYKMGTIWLLGHRLSIPGLNLHKGYYCAFLHAFKLLKVFQISSRYFHLSTIFLDCDDACSCFNERSLSSDSLILTYFWPIFGNIL